MMMMMMMMGMVIVIMMMTTTKRKFHPIGLVQTLTFSVKFAVLKTPVSAQQKLQSKATMRAP
eukprot:7932465-Karenia_brevis.AAC.1